MPHCLILQPLLKTEKHVKPTPEMVAREILTLTKVIWMISLSIPHMQQARAGFLANVEQDLRVLIETYETSKVMKAAIQCLCVVVERV